MGGTNICIKDKINKIVFSLIYRDIKRQQKLELDNILLIIIAFKDCSFTVSPSDVDLKIVAWITKF